MTVAGPRRSSLADCGGSQHGHHEEDDTAGEDDADHGQCLDRGGQLGPGDGGVAERTERADGSADRTAEEEQTEREESEGELSAVQVTETAALGAVAVEWRKGGRWSAMESLSDESRTALCRMRRIAE
ncbi:hypothetical protein [Kitasatospora griseola]|uniref:hypothetical protein n=1 Tax=Kitasatospora griseola TaxID=2064 RepID=UPI0036609BAF